ncbi:hypothetical protein L6452_36183 [Arctium lappa]|uniref:Uncharacterized protein n=1 Tax=Arctium lappa TaxID=4217 RepID=A0ACB8Y951_ARCLA|nr:hypothetical protein L6452_36183 [Arctium lappa]
MGTSGINVFQFLALHRPSNGPWTKRPLPERTMSMGPPRPPQGRAARRFLTLAGYDMKCVTPNAIKSKALVDLLAHFPSGEYEYAPPSEQNSQLQYWRKPTNLRKLASNVNSTHVQQNVP